jgi:hypothetical protein
MAHDSFRPDLPLRHKQINLNWRSYRPRCACLDKQTSNAEVANSRDIILNTAAPINRHALDGIDA